MRRTKPDPRVAPYPHGRPSVSAPHDWNRWLSCSSSRHRQDGLGGKTYLPAEAAMDAAAWLDVAEHLHESKWPEDSPLRAAELAAALAHYVHMLAEAIADGAEMVGTWLLDFDLYGSSCSAVLRLNDGLSRAGAGSLRSVAARLREAASERRHPDGDKAIEIASALAGALTEVAAHAPPHGAPPCHPRRDATDAERAEWTEMRAAGQRAVEQAGAWGERAEDAARTLRQAASEETRPAREASAAVARAAV